MSPSDNEGNGALVDRNPGEIEPGILVDETKCGEDGAVALLKEDRLVTSAVQHEVGTDLVLNHRRLLGEKLIKDWR